MRGGHGYSWNYAGQVLLGFANIDEELQCRLIQNADLCVDIVLQVEGGASMGIAYIQAANAVCFRAFDAYGLSSQVLRGQNLRFLFAVLAARRIFRIL
jgi:hypothetical protein